MDSVQTAGRNTLSICFILHIESPSTDLHQADLQAVFPHLVNVTRECPQNQISVQKENDIILVLIRGGESFSLSLTPPLLLSPSLCLSEDESSACGNLQTVAESFQQ